MLRLAIASVMGFGLFLCVAPVPASGGPVTRQIDRTLPEMKFTGVTFGEAVDFLRDVSGLNMHVNWKALAEQNVTPDTPVNIRLRAVSMRKVLNLLLSEAAGGDTLAWYVDGGVVEITTKELSDRKMYTKVYPVDDLIMDVPDFTNAPDFSLQSTTEQGQGGRGGGGGSGSGLFQNADQNGNKEPTKTKQERGEELAQLVKEMIQPDVWADAGGTATIRYFNGSLIVTAPRSVHEALGGSWD
jgi:hypothetical protein